MKLLLMLKQVLSLDTKTNFFFIILLLEHNNIIWVVLRYGRMGKTKGFIEPKGSRRRVRVKTKGFIKPLALGWFRVVSTF